MSTIAAIQLTFAVDYDGTFSRDPIAFKKIIRGLLADGHEVRIVTGRTREHPIEDRHLDRLVGVPIHYAGPVYKRAYMNAIGVRVDIWIDDDPGSIAPGNFPIESPTSEL